MRIKTSVEWNAGILFSIYMYLQFIMYFVHRDYMLVKRKPLLKAGKDLSINLSFETL